MLKDAKVHLSNINWWRTSTFVLLSMFICSGYFQYRMEQSTSEQISFLRNLADSYAYEEPSIDGKVSMMVNFRNLYHQHGAAVEKASGLDFMMSGESALKLMVGQLDEGDAININRDLADNIGRIQVLGDERRFIVSAISKSLCYKLASKEMFSVETASQAAEGLKIMVSNLSAPSDTGPKCFEQKWGGQLSPYFSELNYNLTPNEVSNYIMYLPLPKPKHSMETDTII